MKPNLDNVQQALDRTKDLLVKPNGKNRFLEVDSSGVSRNQLAVIAALAQLLNKPASIIAYEDTHCFATAAFLHPFSPNTLSRVMTMFVGEPEYAGVGKTGPNRDGYVTAFANLREAVGKSVPVVRAWLGDYEDPDATFKNVFDSKYPEADVLISRGWPDRLEDNFIKSFSVVVIVCAMESEAEIVAKAFRNSFVLERVVLGWNDDRVFVGRNSEPKKANPKKKFEGPGYKTNPV